MEINPRPEMIQPNSELIQDKETPVETVDEVSTEVEAGTTFVEVVVIWAWVGCETITFGLDGVLGCNTNKSVNWIS